MVKEHADPAQESRPAISEKNPVGAGPFAQRVLAWFDRHGRTDLPWQQSPTPYRVWVSEIMLQQTQVTTVIGYFDRFMQRFPDVQSLAAAPADEVLHLWTGLGYYARARNLQRAAQRIVSEFGGEFPLQADVLATLPGIGRSTAGAIVALSSGVRAPILDGNVKRVLARFHAVAGDKNSASVLDTLWTHADAHTPATRIAAYTQAMMDLGATLCTRSKPRCEACPLAADCRARAQGNPLDYPGRKAAAKATPVRAASLLLLRNTQGQVLLEQRPPAGLWGGLWCFPQCDTPPGAALPEHELGSALAARGLRERARAPLPSFRHTFSHFHLDIAPLLVDVIADAQAVSEQRKQAWITPAQPGTLGLAAPVVRLLAALALPEQENQAAAARLSQHASAPAKSRRRSKT
jgi:A/G-specific adenine glycosylase